MKEFYIPRGHRDSVLILLRTQSIDGIRQYFAYEATIVDDLAWNSIIGEILEEEEFTHLKTIWQKINILA